MGQQGDVQRGDHFVALKIEEAVDRGVNGAVRGLEEEVDAEVLVEVIAMTSPSRAG